MIKKRVTRIGKLLLKAAMGQGEGIQIRRPQDETIVMALFVQRRFVFQARAETKCATTAPREATVAYPTCPALRCPSDACRWEINAAPRGHETTSC